MRARNEKWCDMADRGRFVFDAKARINGKTYTAISAPRIDRTVMTEPLSVGNCNSATLKLSILTDDEIPKQAKIQILGRLRNETTATGWKEFGTFFIDQRDTSFEGLVTIDAFDAMLKTNEASTAANIGLNPGGPPTHMKTLVELIASTLCVGVDPRTVIRTANNYTDYYVPQSVLADSTLSQILGYIAGCHGGNWIITEENLLRLVPLVTAPDETLLPDPTGERPNPNSYRRYYRIVDKNGPLNIPGDHVLVYDTDESAIAALENTEALLNVPVVCGKLTTGRAVTVSRVTVTTPDGTEYTKGDDTGYTLRVDNNPCVSQNICNDLYDSFCGLVYLPFTATKALYDPATELGDQVIIGENVRSVICGMRMTLDHNFRSDISAPNNKDLSSEYPFLSKRK